MRIKMRVLCIPMVITLTGCFGDLKGAGGSSSDSDLDLFSKSFQERLIQSGLSAEDAAFIAQQSQSSFSLSSKLSMKISSLLNSPWENIAAETMKGALRAVSDNAHFPSAIEKQDALEAIGKAHMSALSDHISDVSEALGLIEIASEAAGEAFNDTGLAGADLALGIERAGKGIIAGLNGSDYSDESLDNLANAFSQGAVRGLYNNPNLAGSNVDLVAALTQGALGELGNDGSGRLTGEGKGLIIREIMRGMRETLEAGGDLTGEEIADFLSNAAAAGQDALADFDPSLGQDLLDEMQDMKDEMPDLILIDPNGSLVSTVPVDCLCSFGGGASAAPGYLVYSENQCLAYCDAIANNNPTSAITALVNGQTAHVYSTPRVQTIDINLADSCVARVGTGTTSIDFKPPNFVDQTMCLEFCAMVPDNGGTKNCYSGPDLIAGDSIPSGGSVLPDTPWEIYPFTPAASSQCTGERFVFYSETYALWVGAQLCNGSSSQYKLYLSSSREGEYRQIADYAGHGQDHCELINPSFTIPDEDNINSGTCQNCSVGQLEDPIGEPVYARSAFGQLFQLTNSVYWADLTTNVYSCGVSIGASAP